MKNVRRRIGLGAGFLGVVLAIRSVSATDPIPFEYVHHDGNRMLYQVFPPPDLDEAGKHPLVLFLHGSDECGTDNTSQIALVPLFWTRQSVRFSSFLVAPQAPCRETRLWGDDRIDVVAGLLDEVLEAFPQIDTRRLYVTGVSAGGFGTFRQIEFFPDRFAAAVALASGFVNADRAVQVAPLICHIPLWVFHGAQDTLEPPTQSDTIVEALQDAGCEPRYTRYPDLGHEIAARVYADEDDELFPWLFSQELPARFRRGDCNGDGDTDVSDAVTMLSSLFLGTEERGCEDACDANDDSEIDISDAVAALSALFLGEERIPPPGVEICGVDPTDDLLDCQVAPSCP